MNFFLMKFAGESFAVFHAKYPQIAINNGI